MAKKIVSSSEPNNNLLVFNTSGRSISFKYQETTIHFKETSARKIKLNDTRIGKAINILWYLGPYFPLEDTEWFLKKYLHRAERQQLSQMLPGLPTWLMERLKTILPSYIPIGYRGYDPELFEKEEGQYELKGSGPEFPNFDFH